MLTDDTLEKALTQRTNAYVAAIDKLRAALESDRELFDATTELREAVELVRCLRRLVSGRSVQEIHKAFGAPGDFGYETPIGAALDSVYRSSWRQP